MMDDNAVCVGTVHKLSIGTLCLVCDEAVPVSHSRDIPKICNKCKAAIMTMREHIEESKRQLLNMQSRGV